MTRLRRFLLAASLTVLLLPGLHVVSFGANEPVLNAGTRDAADQGALSITLFLTDALHLTQSQAQAVRLCTCHELEQLAAPVTDTTPPDAALLVRKQYEETMATVLTPAQYTTFRQLEQSPRIAGTVSRVLASR